MQDLGNEFTVEPADRITLRMGIAAKFMFRFAIQVTIWFPIEKAGVELS